MPASIGLPESAGTLRFWFLVLVLTHVPLGYLTILGAVKSHTLVVQTLLKAVDDLGEILLVLHNGVDVLVSIRALVQKRLGILRLPRLASHLNLKGLD